MTRVLVVDDVADNVKLLAYDLEDQGYEVLTALSGREALAVAAATPPDVILLDIMMPGLDGLETCRRLKADPTLRHVPVIMVSARNQESDIIHGLDAGAQDYVTKPFDARIVAARVRAAVRVKEADDENRRLLGELRTANAELDLARRQLEMQNGRLAALKETAYQFVDNVSHEFRTPLTVIREYAAILRDGLAGPVAPQQQEYLGVIAGRVDDLALMVDDMLDISKLEAGLLPIARASASVDRIIARARPMLERRAAAARVTLTVTCPADLPPVFCDAEKAERVLINLVVNALKFTPEGGRVELWARAPAEPGVVEIGVTDTGPGIATENLTSIFERFEQLENSARSSVKGFGLGLNIARDLAHLNLGAIRVESTVGAGSTFAFTVPRDDSAVVLQRYLDQLLRCAEGPTHVSLATATAPPTTTAAASTEPFLQRQLRRHDLLLPAGRAAWGLVLAADPVQLDEALTRIRARLAGAAARSGPLPPLTVTAVGSWRLGDQRDEFLMHARALVAPSVPGSACTATASATDTSE